MPDFECLVCGTSFYSLEHPRLRCDTCGGEHFHASIPGDSAQRYPRAYHPGDHASLIYRDYERLLDVVVPYIRTGLAAGDRVVGVIDSEARGLICARLRADEIAGIEFVSPGDVYGEPFDVNRTRELYAGMVDESEQVLRVLGGLDRSSARSIDASEYAQLEQRSEELFERDLTALCLYDARYCSGELLDIAADHALLTGREVVHLAA